MSDEIVEDIIMVPIRLRAIENVVEIASRYEAQVLLHDLYERMQTGETIELRRMATND